MCLIFVVDPNHENILTTKISRFTVNQNCKNSIVLSLLMASSSFRDGEHYVAKTCYYRCLSIDKVHPATPSAQIVLARKEIANCKVTNLT